MTEAKGAADDAAFEIPFPNVSGEWVMDIYWNRDQESGKIEAETFIRHDESGIGMTVRSSGSDSHTMLVHPAHDASGDPILYYIYEVVPKATHSDAPGPYKGAAILRYYPNGQELSGNYWTSQRTAGHFKLVRKTEVEQAIVNHETDVVLITAIPEEYSAAKQVFTASCPDENGVRDWREIEGTANLLYERGSYYRDGQLLFSIAMARPSRMGGIDTGQLAARLADRLRPKCLVMCGVCAGNPNDLALGDVIVSELAYQYDEGKIDTDGFFGDHRQSLVSEGWRRAAESLNPETLPSYGKPSQRDMRFWVLERLHGGDNPKNHPARPRYFGKGEWANMIDMLEAEKVIKVDAGSLTLTAAGTAEVTHSLLRDVDPPDRLPFAIKVGPIASGNVVVKDGITWESLKAMGVRSVLGLEMEAAAIGRAARGSGVAEWIVIKGVMDHADPKKDDRYKRFAARASAEVLCTFLVNRFLAGRIEQVSASSTAPSSTSAASVSTALWRPLAIEGPFFDELRSAMSDNAQRFVKIYDLAITAARDAQKLASVAHDKSDEVRTLLGSEIAKTHGDSLGPKPTVLRALSSAGLRPLIAKIWNSHDEYLGEAVGDEADGLGVLRVYQISEELTPSLRSSYAGHLEAGKYGPSGVFNFPDQSHFAGRWVSGHPNFGYREYVGSMPSLDCDFYLGSMRGVANHLAPLWQPHGEGIAVDANARHVRCGVLADGKFDVIEFEFNF